ncbi:heparin lyase I family protein [Adhaeribacter swui]|uniref:Heparin lyase I family protein n=1 Tax=Adhaeribacter swui TaxID=2086471 RepID=A0A7G7GDH0_9BACT|nr:polysaccharide lyase [Adhaeribacter swui]QNF35204.1 heparin lyase I family protein [Adhaeribacter swui]
MRTKLLLFSTSLLALLSVGCETVESLEPEEVSKISTAISSDAYVTSADGSRSNLLVEERIEPTLSSVFGKEIFTGHAYSETTSMARTGSKSMRFELRSGDPNVRSEIWRESETGNNRWYGMSMYLPSANWGTDSEAEGWDIITQLHPTNDNSKEEGRTPPIALSVIRGQLKLVVCWATQATNTNSTRSGKLNFELGPVEKDKWLDMVYHIKFSYLSDGIIEVWKNGVKVIDYRGPNCYNDAKLPRLKIGIYKRNWNGVSKRVTYVDDVRVGDGNATYNDVAPRLSSTPSVPAPQPQPEPEPQPETPTTSHKVESFTLMNADSDQPIQTLTNGAVLSLSKLPTKNLNIRANTNNNNGAVVFNLSGAKTYSRNEGTAPYAIFGDTNGDYKAWVPAVGKYTLKATSAAGIVTTISFSVQN